MANSNIVPIKNAIEAARDKFLQMKEAGDLDWQAESLFALQAVSKNEKAMQTAVNNPGSLKLAMANAGAIGVSLNPALAHAYLVPREGRIILDISYRGLIHLAVTSGSILWAKAELVYEKDQFEYRGVDQKPIHKFNPFSEVRGKFVGAYCVAKLPDGTYLTEAMTAREIDKVRQVSRAKNGPWKTWFEEMAKKTVIKRAAKTWPNTSVRLLQAISMLNEEEGMEDRYMADNQSPEPESGTVIDQVEPADESEVDADTKGLTEAVIRRAKASGAWAAARDYLKERIPDLRIREWALQQLQQAEQAG